ncbi:MAG: glycosyltransferase [Mycobacterium pseudokansasii]|uniref:Glycosyltransferase 2-like domain-containing protein n=1 Tax=Mycobacterium pseudokansasii TaxID=2341080 RepID=A0A498QSS0_9MYCO|nr:glycosyltransferase [Mycobacterium pseudokansasii]MBY0390138.1 glycosyltransferase [Mycobacterium pseudokansasii]VBA49746.1 hypothetical protein LAUMK142_02162 [Mycobacterium pseudokansasii]
MASVGVGRESRSGAGSSSHTVTIVIPAYNEERFIAKCLAHPFVKHRPPDEIIVVDNRSTDGNGSSPSAGPPVGRDVDQAAVSALR